MRVFENRVLRSTFGTKMDEVKRNGENYILSSLMIRTGHEYHSGDQIESNEIGGACSKYMGNERCV